MNIHKTAIIHPKAKIAEDVIIGPYSSVGKNVTIGKGCRIGQGVVIEGWTTIGEGCKFFTGAIIGSITQDLKYKGRKTYLEIGNNNTFREYVTVNLGTSAGSKTVIGDNNHIMAYAHIAHDCVIGNNVVLANAATLAGYVKIEDRAIIGGLVGIHQFCRVGKLSIIGGCSKIVKDIPPYVTADGHPAICHGLNVIGIKRNKISTKIYKDLKQAYKILYSSDLPVSNAIEKIKKDIDFSEEISNFIKFIETSERGISK